MVDIPDKKLQLPPFNLHDGEFNLRNQLRNQIFVKKGLTFLLSEQAADILVNTSLKKEKASSDSNKHKYHLYVQQLVSKVRKY